MLIPFHLSVHLNFSPLCCVFLFGSELKVNPCDFYMLLICLYRVKMAHTFMTENHDEEEYKVKWDNYNLTSLLSNSSISPDVTLVTEDGIERESHRIILAAISPFLKELMLSTTKDDVLIYLDGICHKYLDLILTVLNTGFVYPNNSDETLEFMNTCLALGINNINLFNDETSLGEKKNNKEYLSVNRIRNYYSKAHC